MSLTRGFVSKQELHEAQKREFSAKQRQQLAKAGKAMPDGSYPIENGSDLDNAVHAIGRGSDDHSAIKAHIIARAKALGLTSSLPDDWNVQKADDEGPEQLTGSFSSRYSLLKKPKKLQGGVNSPMNVAAISAALTSANS